MELKHYILLGLLVMVLVILAVQWRKVHSAWLNLQKFLREVRVEMQKVSWPSKNEIYGSTLVVLTAIIALTVVITVWDQVLSLVLQLILPGSGV